MILPGRRFKEILATAERSSYSRLVSLAAMLLVAGCTTLAEYRQPPLSAPSGWTNMQSGAPPAAAAAGQPNWWAGLGDPAVDQLVAAALADNPTLAEAAARMDEARANVAFEEAGRRPRVDVDGGGAVTRSVGGGTIADIRSGGGNRGASATLTPRLAWDIDLWGRVRANVGAARSRLDARTADATDARLAIIAHIANAVLELRACNYSLGVRDADIASRETELRITRLRLSFGSVAPVAVANASSNLASVRTERIARAEECLRLSNDLVALSGVPASDVAALVVPPSRAADMLLPDKHHRSPGNGPETSSWMPSPSPLRPALPATILLTYPSVVAAEREVAARWSEIGAARAKRLPRIDLVALLTGQWISTVGSSLFGSIGPSIAGPLFDGGAGSASVRGAEARYREAVASLHFTVRTAIRDVENALIAQASSQQRLATSQAAVSAASLTFRATQARWEGGAISLFELEDARRQLNAAQESAIVAARDRAQSWIELSRRTVSAGVLDLINPQSGSGTMPSGRSSQRR